MSGLEPEHNADARAAAIKHQAAVWLERRDRADWSEQDQCELDAWLGASTANFLAYQRVARAWGRAERLVALEPHEFQSAGAVRSTSGRSFFMRAAALVATLALFTLGSAAYVLMPKVRLTLHLSAVIRRSHWPMAPSLNSTLTRCFEPTLGLRTAADG